MIERVLAHACAYVAVACIAWAVGFVQAVNGGHSPW